MDTSERKKVRELAYTMEQTFRGDPEGLHGTQQNAHHAIELLREGFPNESDDTLCCVARAISYMVGTLSQTPTGLVSPRMEVMISCYPLAAGALAGVYVLPEHECERKGRKGANAAPVAPEGRAEGEGQQAPRHTDDLRGTGQYL